MRRSSRLKKKSEEKRKAEETLKRQKAQKLEDARKRQDLRREENHKQEAKKAQADRVAREEQERAAVFSFSSSVDGDPLAFPSLNHASRVLEEQREPDSIRQETRA